MQGIRRFEIPMMGKKSLSALWESPEHPRAAVLLAHGGGTTKDHPALGALAAGLLDRSFAVLRFNFPYTEAGRKVPDHETILVQSWLQVFAFAVECVVGDLPVLAAGRSLGGRMASLAAARHPREFAPCGLVFFAYPLHSSGRPDRLRTEHLGRVRIPMLFLSGTRDTLAKVELLERAVGELPTATLHWLEGADHGYRVLKRDGRSDEDMIGEAAKAVSGWFDRMFPGEIGRPLRSSVTGEAS